MTRFPFFGYVSAEVGRRYSEDPAVNSGRGSARTTRCILIPASFHIGFLIGSTRSHTHSVNQPFIPLVIFALSSLQSLF